MKYYLKKGNILAKQHLLIVDSDPKSLRVLEVSLKKAGFSVTRAVNGADAIEKIHISTPDLIISDTTMPEMDGFELNIRLKENPEWADIPFIFLTAQKSIEDKIRGLEQGVEDYLTKPIFIREILARVSLVLQRRQREHLENRGSKTKFSGDLSDMGIIDLIQTIDISRKSGVIHVERDDDKGKIFFRDGKVIDAQTDNRSAEDAVYRMLVWSDGAFEIEFENIDNADTITLSTQGLLMEGMRRLDEWGRLQEQLPPLTAIFDVNDEMLSERLSEIPDEINGVLKHFDGRNSLMTIVDNGDMSDLEALTVISKLYFEGLICELDETELTSLKKEHTDHFDDSELPSAQEHELCEFSDDSDLSVLQSDAPHYIDEDISSTLKLPRIDVLPKRDNDKPTSMAGGFVAALSQIPPHVAEPSEESAAKLEKAPVPPVEQDSNIPTKQPPDPLAHVPRPNLVEALDAAIPPPDDLAEDPVAQDDDQFFQGETYARQFGSPATEPETEPPVKEKSDNDESEKELEKARPINLQKTIATFIIVAALAGGGILAWRIWGKHANNFKSTPDLQLTVKNNEKQASFKPLIKKTTDENKPLQLTSKEQTQKKQPTISHEKPEASTDFNTLSAEKIVQYNELFANAIKMPRKKKIEMLKQAVKINASDDKATAELSLLLMEYKKTRQEAKDFAKLAVQANPDNGKAWLALGYIYQLNGNNEQSRKAYIKCSKCSGPNMIVRDCKRILR